MTSLMPWIKPPPAVTLTWLFQEPARIYHAKAKQFLSSHQLGHFRTSPYLYWRYKAGLIPDKDADYFLMGRAAHTLILEGSEVFAREYAVGGPINEKTGKPFGKETKAYQEWAIQAGKPVLTDSEVELANNLRDGVFRNPLAKELLAQGVAEGVVRATYCDEACQIRPDWVNPIRGMVDLKTCANLTFFESDARKYQYIHQMAFYRAVIAAHTGLVLPVHIIAVEKQEPFRCGVWRVGDDVLAIAQQTNQEAIARLHQCRERDEWPTGYEDARTLDYI